MIKSPFNHRWSKVRWSKVRLVQVIKSPVIKSPFNHRWSKVRWSKVRFIRGDQKSGVIQVIKSLVINNLWTGLTYHFHSAHSLEPCKKYTGQDMAGQEDISFCAVLKTPSHFSNSLVGLNNEPACCTAFSLVIVRRCFWSHRECFLRLEYLVRTLNIQVLAFLGLTPQAC